MALKLNNQGRTRKSKKFKVYKRQLKSEMFEIDNEIVLNDSNDAIIECKVGELENIFSQYDIAKNRTISENFHNYLMLETEIIPTKHDLELKLYTNKDTTEEQQTQIKRAIKRHYRFMITSTNVELRKTNLIATLLYIFGLMTLMLNFVSELFISNLPLKETLLIGTWFFMWEATNKAFFERNSLKHYRYNMLRVYNAKITFVVSEVQIR